MMTPWKHQRVLIIGVARQGLSLARYLVQQGAQVTLNDQRTAEQLSATRQALADLPVIWALGGHNLDLLDKTDTVCVSGGVPLTMPLVVEAFRRGIKVTNDSQIFLEAVPCKVIGITGSAGKTTTTTLVGRIAQASALSDPALRKVWVGGNIGLPLVEYLDEIDAHDLVILELSSFQLEIMTLSPQVAAVLNITPNHLDRHLTMENYTAAKAHILSHQHREDTAILNRDDAGSWALRSLVQGNLLSFGSQKPASGIPGTFIDDGQLSYTDGTNQQVILSQDQIALRGQHNRLNVLAAATITLAAGLSPRAVAEGVQGFGGVAHRLELVRTLHGVRWYNDSIATAPERAIAAIQSFSEPLVLLLGGRDKNLPWDTLADLIHQRVDHVIVFGEAGDKIRQAIGSLKTGQLPLTLVQCTGLAEAVQAAAQVATEGDVVLLSPGGTSYDEFTDFEERGERYRLWVTQLD